MSRENARSIGAMARRAISLALLLVASFAQAQGNAAVSLHVAQRGETLANIAQKYSLAVEDVANANGMALTDSLLPGDRLIIPLGLSGSAAVTAAIPQSVPAQASLARAHSFSVTGTMPDAYFHTVASGETLFLIGLQYNLTVDTIASANNLADPDVLRIGQRLAVPGIELPRLTSELPETVLSFTLDPLVFIEGKTARIELQTRESATVSGTLLESELVVIASDDGKLHNILVGAPMFTPTAIYPLQLTLTDADGNARTITADVQFISGGYLRQSLTIDDSDLLAKEVEEAELAQLSSVAAQFTPERKWQKSLDLPAADNMNAFFGTLRSYNGSPFNRYHSGTDFAGATGAPVKAAAAGTVKLVDRLLIRGNTIMIDHGWGIYTLYAHLNEALTQAGAQVEPGEIIGAIGSTGRSTGPHLHWEVWVNGVNVDPMQWVNEQFP